SCRASVEGPEPIGAAAPPCQPKRMRPQPGRVGTARSRGCSPEHRASSASLSLPREPPGPHRGRVMTEAERAAPASAFHATPSRGRSTRQAAPRRLHLATHTRSEPRQRPHRKATLLASLAERRAGAFLAVNRSCRENVLTLKLISLGRSAGDFANC